MWAAKPAAGRARPRTARAAMGCLSSIDLVHLSTSCVQYSHLKKGATRPPRRIRTISALPVCLLVKTIFIVAPVPRAQCYMLASI